jgi:hypothetical protein
MRTVNSHPSLKDQPLRLTEKEMQNPYGALEDFFSCFQLQYTREMLWNWLVVAMSSEADIYSSGESRSNLVYFYEKLELLIEAAYEINKRRKENYHDQS